MTGGYGAISGERGAGNMPAHVFSYRQHIADVPAGKIVRHSCDNPGCVNPAHLILGTHAQNMRDMAHRGRRIGRGTGTSLTAAQVAVVNSVLAGGGTQREAARAVGKTDRSIIVRAKARGDLREGASSGARKLLSDDEKAEAVRMLAAGERVMVVAKRFGVDRKTIRNIRPDHIPSPPRGRPVKVQ